MNKDQLDISIKEMKNIITSEMKAEALFNTEITIDEKYDGTKLTLVRNSKPYSKDYTKNWIVAYKGSIIYPTEFTMINKDQVKSDSVGISQYALVHETLEKANPRLKDIPIDTEFLVEFIMDKPTLTRTYSKKHVLVLIAYAHTTILSASNSLRTAPNEFEVAELGKYSKALGMALPSRLFKGKLKDLPNGLSDNALKSYHKYEAELETATNATQKEQVIRKIFTNFESSLGGKPEGVVIKGSKNNIIGKYVNEDQYSKDNDSDRVKKKHQWKMGHYEETVYNDKIGKVAKEMITSNQFEGTFANSLETLSRLVYTMDLSFVEHDKKDNFKKQDDLYLTAKLILLKKQKGNNWCAFQGRFQPPTKAHIDIIRKYARIYDGVYIIVVNNNSDKINNPFSDKTRMDILQKGLKGLEGKYKVKFTTSGMLPNTVNSLDHNINAIIGGTDRKEEYQKFANQMKVKFIEIKRTDAGISATKVRDSLLADDKNGFKDNMGFFDPSMFAKMKSEMASLKVESVYIPKVVEECKCEFLNMNFVDFIGE